MNYKKLSIKKLKEILYELGIDDIDEIKDKEMLIDLIIDYK